MTTITNVNFLIEQVLYKIQSSIATPIVTVASHFNVFDYDVTQRLLYQDKYFSLFLIVGIIIVLSLLHLIVIIVSAGISSLTERKIFAAAQRRQGPAVVGFGGILQFLADGIKLLTKEVISPYPSTFVTFILAPMIVFITAMVGWTFIPTDFGYVFIDLELNVLWVFTFSSLGVYGLILAGWSSNSKYSFLGALRSAAQMVSYEVSLGFIIICVALISGSYNFTKIVLSQFEVWNFMALWPLAVAFYISILAETNRAPFDLPEAEAELVAGYNLEYSAIPFALFFLGEYSSMLMMSGIFILFFLGGWFFFPNFFKVFFKYILAFLTWGYDWVITHLFSFAKIVVVLLTNIVRYIFLALNFLAKFTFGFVLGAGSFILAVKIIISLIFFIVIRASYPRYRYDHLMSIGWKIFLPLTLGYLLFIAGILKVFGGLPEMVTEVGLEQKNLYYNLSSDWSSEYYALSTQLAENLTAYLPVAYADGGTDTPTGSGNTSGNKDGDLHLLSGSMYTIDYDAFDFEGYVKEQNIRKFYELAERSGAWVPGEEPRKGEPGYPTAKQMHEQAVEMTAKYIKEGDTKDPMAMYVPEGATDDAQFVDRGLPDFGYDFDKPGIHTPDRIINLMHAGSENVHPVAAHHMQTLYIETGNACVFSEEFYFTEELDKILCQFARVELVQILKNFQDLHDFGKPNYSHAFELDGLFQTYVKNVFGNVWPEGVKIPTIRDILQRQDDSSLRLKRILIGIYHSMRMDEYEDVNYKYALHYQIVSFFLHELDIVSAKAVHLDNPLNQRGPLPGPQYCGTPVMKTEEYYKLVSPPGFW